MDMLDERPVSVIDGIDKEKYKFSEEIIQKLCEDEIEYAIFDDIFTDREDILKKAREEGIEMMNQGHLKDAGYGRGNDYQNSKQVRGDQLVWLSKLSKPNSPQENLDTYHHLKTLALQLNDFKYILNNHLKDFKLDDQEIQLALYQGKGEFYLRHKDAFRLDLNNISEGQKLRKITSIVYLNDEIPEKIGKQWDVGLLRLYLKQEIVDVVPRIGRVIMFKSEKVEHEVKPTQGYQRFAMTSWFHQTYKRPELEKNLNEEKEDSIFVGIVSYRDPQLIPTLQNLLENANNKENLTFGLFIQNSLDDEEEKTQIQELQQIISKNSSTKFVYELIPHTEAKNAYYARFRLQKLYSHQTYYLQIDSHMRFVKNWDILLIKYLSECQNPKKSILTQYPKSYNFKDKEFESSGPLAMCFKEFSPIDGLPRFRARIIKREDKFERPFRSLFWAAGMSFSYGKLVQDCGYTDEIDDVFFGEEIFQMKKFMLQGYEMYSPPRNIVYHYWSRDYRKTYKQDHIQDQSRVERQKQCLEIIRAQITKDKEFVQKFLEKTGVDLANKLFNEFAENGGLDPQFF